MLANCIHIALACILGCSLFYAVYYNDKEEIDENEYSVSNVMETPSEELFETNMNINYVVPEKDLIDTIIDERYVVGDLMAVGHIGSIRSGFDQDTETDVIIKFVQPGELAEFLETEYQNYLLLGAEDPSVMQSGIPNVMFYGEHSGYKVLIMQMLGPTLQEMKGLIKRHKLSGKTILKIAIQLMDVFNYIHSKGLCVYDISSSNIAIGNTRENMNKVFVFDFAMSVEISREFLPKTDLLLLGLVLLDLNGVQFPKRNNLNTNADNKEAIESLLQKWDQSYVNELCSKSDHPKIFLEYFKYLESLKSNQYPHYEKIKEIFAEDLSFDELRKESLGIFDSFLD